MEAFSVYKFDIKRTEKQPTKDQYNLKKINICSSNSKIIHKETAPNHLNRQHRIRSVLLLVAGRAKPFRIRNTSTSKHQRSLTAPKILSLSLLNKCISKV